MLAGWGKIAGAMRTPPRTPNLPDWALVVVDLQNDFLHEDGYYSRRSRLSERADWEQLSSDQQASLLEELSEIRQPGARSPAIAQVVRNVCAAISAARAADRPIVFVRAVYDRQFDTLPPLLQNDPDRKHFPCKPGRWGTRFFGAMADAIDGASRASERIFDKHTYDAFSNPALLPFLQDARVNTVAVCGAETQVCVAITAQRAALLGFRAFILEDCVWSADNQAAEVALRVFRDAYGGTLTITDLPGPDAET